MVSITKTRKSPNQFKHGFSNTKTYQCWEDMKKRCDNKKSKLYHRYGGRGVSYDKRWSNFLLFIEDMGLKPSSDYELDRIDNNGNYEKSNCRWVSLIRNAQNKNLSDRLRGTYLHKRTGLYVSQIKIAGIQYYLGYFETEQLAHDEYRKVFVEWYGFEPEKFKENKI